MKPKLIFVNNPNLKDYLLQNGVKEFGNKPNCFDINLLEKKGLSLNELKVDFNCDNNDILFLNNGTQASKVVF